MPYRRLPISLKRKIVAYCKKHTYTQTANEFGVAISTVWKLAKNPGFDIIEVYVGGLKQKPGRDYTFKDGIISFTNHTLTPHP